MFKIGIVGSDNTHADHFSKLLNIPDEVTGEYKYPGYRVTAIFGLDEQRTREVAEKGRIEYIAEKPEDMMGKVDAVMVVFRHGDLHMQYALPFIEAGIPTWIDKPFTVKKEDARKLIAASKEKGTLITGGSTCKYINDIAMIRSTVETGSRIGKVKTAVINFPADLNSEYAGIHFYGHHLVEMTLASFGYDPKSVIASENNGIVTAILKYDRYQITMNFIFETKQYAAVLYGEKGIMYREIDITGCYKPALEKFLAMLETGKMPESYERLYAPVQIMNAVEKAYKTGEEVQIDCFNV